MGNRNRSNVLLVEILIAVLFFMLSATVLVQVFATAHSLTVRAGVETRALAQAQNIVEVLAAADDADAELAAMEFSKAHGAWTRSYGDYTLYIESTEVPAGAGTMWQGDVRAFYNVRDLNAARQADDELFSLPCARYKGGRS